MNVSSVKNLNGEVFSAVQDASLTNVVQTNSGNWQDITAYQSNSASYLTAVDLTPYQTIEGMTAYQPVGDYATTNELEQVSADITATIPSTAGLASESYVQTNSAVLTGMIDGKQDTLTFGYDEQDRINSINSSALAGGGDVPEDVMVETNLEYNAVGEISGYGSSAIAQYGAEKQWLVHDDTIVHISNSAQYAFGCNVSALQRLMGIDETVLFSTAAYNNQLSAIPLSEPASSFDRIRIYDSKSHTQEFWWDAGLNINDIMLEHNTTGTRWVTYWKLDTTNTQNITFSKGWLETVTNGVPNTNGSYEIPVGAPYGRFVHPMKVVGIGRKEI